MTQRALLVSNLTNIKKISLSLVQECQIFCAGAWPGLRGCRECHSGKALAGTRTRPLHLHRSGALAHSAILTYPLRSGYIVVFEVHTTSNFSAKKAFSQCQQHPVLPYGHPSKYWLGSTLLNFSDCLESWSVPLIRPLTNNWGLKCNFEFNTYFFIVL